VREHAYLVSRGVRAIALVGACEANGRSMMRARELLKRNALPGPLPFVLDCGNNRAEYGYAVADWALDLYRWTNDAERTRRVPARQCDRIFGLLFGYSPEAIGSYDRSSGMIARTRPRPILRSQPKPDRRSVESCLDKLQLTASEHVPQLV